MAHYAKVVFPQRFPKGVSDVFDYAVPASLTKKILPGSGVLVSFRNTKRIGVVVSLDSSTSVPANRIKSIESILGDTPIVTKVQQKVLFWLKEKTGSTLGTIVNLFIPEKPKKLSYDLSVHATTRESAHQNNHELHWFDSSADQLAFLEKKLSLRNQSTLLVFPEREQVEHFSRIISKKKPTVSTGKDSQKEHFLAWQSVYSNKAKNVVGTRNALLLPFHELHQIIVVHEEDKTHQRIEQHPDIDTRELAKYVGEQFGSTVIFTTVAPSVESLYKAKQASWNIIRHKASHVAKIQIIDTSEFLKKRQSTLLPQDAVDFIENEPKKVVLIYNRKGYSSLIRCTDCGWEAHCSRCGAYLSSSHQASTQLYCKRCHQETIMPIQCPRCHNVRLRMQVPGINQLAERLKKMIPNAAIEILEKNSHNKKTQRDAQIIFTTQYGIPRIPWESVGACMLLDTDFSLNFPDYRAAEWTIQRIRKIVSLLTPDATLFLLTKHPQNPVFAAIEKNAPEPWYDGEIEERKKLQFPPFSSHIGLTLLASSFQERASKEQACIQAVQTSFSQSRIAGTIISLSDQEQKTQSHFASNLLVRVPESEVPKTIERLEPLRKQGWKITINPLDANLSGLYT